MTVALTTSTYYCCHLNSEVLCLCTYSPVQRPEHRLLLVRGLGNNSFTVFCSVDSPLTN